MEFDKRFDTDDSVPRGGFSLIRATLAIPYSCEQESVIISIKIHTYIYIYIYIHINIYIDIDR